MITVIVGVLLVAQALIIVWQAHAREQDRVEAQRRLVAAWMEVAAWREAAEARKAARDSQG